MESNVSEDQHKALRHLTVNRDQSLNSLVLEILASVVRKYRADAHS